MPMVFFNVHGVFFDFDVTVLLPLFASSDSACVACLASQDVSLVHTSNGAQGAADLRGDQQRAVAVYSGRCLRFLFFQNP